MDPITTLTSCYTLYQSIQTGLDTVVNNRSQFELLKLKVAEIAEPIDRLKALHAKGQLPCTDKALEGLHRTLEKVQVFVQQKRFSRTKSVSAAGVLSLVAELYHGADDKEQFIQFDRMLSSSLQSLNLHITVKILDYTMAATKDAARAAEATAEIQLTQIDNKLLEWNPNSASEKIGYGAFSMVCTGRYKKEYVAIKVIQQLGTMSARDLKLITKEAMIMQFADHPNILKLKGVSLAKGLLVMELALCSLSDYLHRANDLARERCQSLRTAVPAPSFQWKLGIVRDVADAIRYLHSFSILHRDIKSANVLLFHDPATGKTTAKVGDFGLALAVELVSRTAGTMQTAAATTVSSQGSQHQARAAGTPHYMAPELFDRRPGESIAYSEASDVYSLGVLANEVLTENVPWEVDAREMDVMKWVLHDHIRPHLWKGSEGATGGAAAALLRRIGGSDIIGSCWSQRPSQRCTAEDVFQSARAIESSGESSPLPVPQGAPPASQAAVLAPVGPTVVMPPAAPPLPSQLPSSKSSGSHSPTVYTRVPSMDDAEQQALISAFSEEIQYSFPNVHRDRANEYAAALVKVTIYDVVRLRKQSKTLKAGTKADSDKWFQTVGIHPFDAADMLDEDGGPTTAPHTRSLAQIQADHGSHGLVVWLKENVPDLALPHKRQHIAEVLFANNVTCAARLQLLAGREDAVPWLVSMQVDKLDAEDVCLKLTTLFASTAGKAPNYLLPPPVQIPVPLALYDQEDFVLLLTADLQQLLPDISAVAAHRYSESLFTCCIYTVPRFLQQLLLKADKVAWLEGLGWARFDLLDMLDTAEIQGARSHPAPYSSDLHGVAPLLQWLTEHLTSLKLASKRQQYAEALVTHNVYTVHRLVVRGNKEAWLVGVGFDQLDAADCAAILVPLAEQDPWKEVRAKSLAVELAAKRSAAELAVKREAAEREANKRAVEAEREQAKECFGTSCCACGYDRHPGSDWLPGDDNEKEDNKRSRDYYASCKPC